MSAQNGEGAGRLRPFRASPEGQFPHFADQSRVIQEWGNALGREVVRFLERRSPAARSLDEVTDLVRALPAWGVWGWKVKPLESFAHRTALEKKVVQELRAKK